MAKLGCIHWQLCGQNVCPCEPSFEALVASDWCPHSLVDLLAGGDVELVEGEHDPLQVLAVLHPVDEVATHDVALQISTVRCKYREQ